MTYQKLLQRVTARVGLTAAASVLALASVQAVSAQDAPTVRILINQSPWLNAFIAMVDAYEDETGNSVELDVTPFGGMVEKARNSIRSDTGTYDIVNISSAPQAEMYSGGFLRPIQEIDPEFSLPEGVLDFGGTAYWNFETGAFDREGTLMGIPTNGNVQVLYYRTDLYEEAGLEVPETWDDLLANAKALHNPPEVYGFVPRAERNSIVYNFSPYLMSFGADYFADPATGDFSVTIASPEALAALEYYINIGKEAGPENAGAIAQAELIQLLSTGKAAQAVAVIAAYSNLQDPNSSIVAGKIGTALLPAGPGGERASAAGHWMAGIPANIPEENQVAALDFLKWFLDRDRQQDYVLAGGVPVRSDLMDDTLANEAAADFIPAFSANAEVSRPYLPLVEGEELKNAIALWLNRAVIGEVTAKEALNGAAQEMHEILTRSGRDLPEPDLL